MKKSTNLGITIAMLVIVGALGGFVSLPANAAKTEAVPFSGDAATSNVQHEVYNVIHQYESALNAGDANAIVDLFAKDSVAEWNDKTTYTSRQQKIDGYAGLFKIAQFNTEFAYDAIDVYNDAAVVRTHHHKGAYYMENGKKMIDYNREVFVLNKVDGVWKIVFYMFNTDPVQGEA